VNKINITSDLIIGEDEAGTDQVEISATHEKVVVFEAGCPIWCEAVLESKTCSAAPPGLTD
jgi:hypothetical protein